MASEDGQFLIKVINEHDVEILVYMDAPPARLHEVVSGWAGWCGPTRTLRGREALHHAPTCDAWNDRIRCRA